MSQPGVKYAFAADDLSVYERVDPDQFPNHDNVDSTVAEAIIAETPSQVARVDVVGNDLRAYDRRGDQVWP